jgi:signal transduction histidine kinase/CheY-like chemotaxis protein/HPt (histidine-containing phosphotransfer) domain-containing protein
MKSHLSQGKSWQGRLLYRRHANHALPDIYDYWVDVSITDIRNIQGKLIGYVQIQRDITDQVNTEQAQRLANADTGARLAISVVLHQALPLVQRITQTFDILFNLEDFHLQPQGGVLLKELDQDFLNIYVLLGNFSEEFIQLEQGIAYSDSLCGRASLSQKLIISDDCNCDQHRQHRLAHGHYIVPIQSAGTTLGILFLYTDPYPVQSESRLTMLQQVGDMLALALLQEQTKNTLELARDAAEQAAKIKAEFLANMSHEIRTPMNGVLGMLDILQDTDVTSEQQDLLKTAATSAESLLSIINDILDFSKLEAGKIELEHIEFNLPLLVEDVCSLMSGRAHAHNLELNCFLPPALPQHWHGDPNRIRQVLTNLIGNAVKFTDQGEVSVKVFLQETGEDDTIVRFEVKDTGIGLSPETQARLFQPFAQADSSTARRFGGTGLGLSISKNLINMMQGTIGVESELGNGACFWFSLPLEASHSKAVARVNDFNHKRVLIVDDNATNRKILSHYLVHCGMDVSEVDNAPAALLALEQAVKNQQAFDLLLSDLHMPDMDGYALAQAISNNPAIAATPRLLLSSGGFGSEADRVKLGFSQTLLKPVRQVQLFEAITNALQGANTHSLTPAKINLNLPNYSSKRLLVVEDNKVNQKVILAMLDKFQCVPDLAENGQVAIDKLAEQSYDLVLMDCQMPIMDGYEAIRILRGQELAQNRQRTPVVALTAHASNDEREKCLSAGMDNFLTKPVIKAELAKILAHWLGQSSFTDNQQSSVESIDDNTNEQMTLVWDKITTLKQLDYDSELLDDMINLFLMDIPVRLADLEQAVALNDVPAIAEAAHAIKGMAGHFFARTLSLHSANLEHSARQNAVVELSQLTKKVEDAAKDLIHAFEQRQSASV